jgi:hypothetical protein
MMRWLALGLLCCSVPFWPREAAAVSIALTPASSSVALGDPVTLTLEVGALAGAAVGGFDVDLSFDAAKLGFLSASFGSALGDPGLGEQLGDVVAGTGTLNLASVSLLDPVALAALQGDPVQLVTLTFTTLAPGSPVLMIDGALLSDAFAAALTVDSQEGASVDVVPEPELALALLLAAAVAGLAGRAQSSHGRAPSSP